MISRWETPISRSPSQDSTHELFVSAPLNVLTEEKPLTKKRSRFSRFTRTRANRRESDSESSNSVLMKFTGTEHVETPVVTLPDDSTLLDEYFSMNEYRSLLFPDNNATMMERTITDDLFTTWCNEAKKGGASGPKVKANINKLGGRQTLELHDTNTEKVEIMKITAVLNMPSLEVRSESIIGVKLLLSETDQSRDSFPELQFTLLDSKLLLEGSKTVTWIFNQLMKYRDSTSSFTRVTAETTGENEIVFTTDARLGINIRIPSAVLKILPSVNVEKFEEQGSLSVQKLLEKDLEPALVSFRNKFETFVNEKDNARLPHVLRP